MAIPPNDADHTDGTARQLDRLEAFIEETPIPTTSNRTDPIEQNLTRLENNIERISVPPLHQQLDAVEQAVQGSLAPPTQPVQFDYGDRAIIEPPQPIAPLTIDQANAGLEITTSLPPTDQINIDLPSNEPPMYGPADGMLP
jgi:hypothetical protein